MVGKRLRGPTESCADISKAGRFGLSTDASVSRGPEGGGEIACRREILTVPREIE